MERIFTALVLGLSAEGLFMCPFLAFGLTLSDRYAGLRFLLGRLAGLVIFGLIVGLLGRSLRIDKRIVNLLFGSIVILLGVYSFLTAKEHGGHKSVIHGRAGFGIGLFRGMLNPGRKYIYLVPLILGTKLFQGMLVSLAYALSSSVYLSLGFVSAGLLERVAPHRRFIKKVGGAILVVMGALYIYKAGGSVR
ncbi:MAG: hypothetical protein WC329_02755 [Candidatus Omnitrophota bacterium]|jgi:cytochrome c biogenesis protein CcdA